MKGAASPEIVIVPALAQLGVPGAPPAIVTTVRHTPQSVAVVTGPTAVGLLTKDPDHTYEQQGWLGPVMSNFIEPYWFGLGVVQSRLPLDDDDDDDEEVPEEEVPDDEDAVLDEAIALEEADVPVEDDASEEDELAEDADDVAVAEDELAAPVPDADEALDAPVVVPPASRVVVELWQPSENAPSDAQQSASTPWDITRNVRRWRITT